MLQTRSKNISQTRARIYHRQGQGCTTDQNTDMLRRSKKGDKHSTSHQVGESKPMPQSGQGAIDKDAVGDGDEQKFASKSIGPTTGWSATSFPGFLSIASLDRDLDVGTTMSTWLG